MLSDFSEIVKRHLIHLPEDDYLVLNTFLFVSTWLHFVLNQGETSMKSVFKRLRELKIFSIDSMIVTLTSKLLWCQGFTKGSSSVA